MENKLILDACCGSKMSWFDKDNPHVLFTDIREEDTTLCDGRKLIVRPDVISDFRQMKFKNESFYIVKFDPPHLVKLGQSSWMGKKYGVLTPNWKEDIKAGFDECMRVLKPKGVLIFKWNEEQIKLADILNLIDYKPLFGHTSGRHGKTIWLCFMKGIT